MSLDNRQVCCDGILVAGSPGHHERLRRLGSSSCNYGFGDASFLIDARGDLKPNITPARTPPDHSYSQREKSWGRLFDVVGRAYSGLLVEVLDECIKCDPSRFWLVVEAYRLAVYQLPLIKVWESLHIPVCCNEGTIEWLPAKNSGSCRVRMACDKNEVRDLEFPGGKRFKIPNEVAAFAPEDPIIGVPFFQSLQMALSTVSSFSPTELELAPDQPDDELLLSDLVTRDTFRWRWFYKCAGNLSKIVCVTGDDGFSNALHPIVDFARKLANKQWMDFTPMERIASMLSWGNVGSPFDSEVSPKSGSARTRKQLGVYHRAIAWNSIHPSLHPPYKVFRLGVGIEEMTPSHLEKWADIILER